MMAVENGWHVLARLHILIREYNLADNNDDAWNAKKDALGFSDYSRAEANNIGKEEWFVIAFSKATELDYRDYLNMWGISFDAKASQQVASFGYPSVPRQYFISSSKGYCLTGENGDFLGKASLPVDGNQSWPADTDQDNDGYWDALDNCPSVFNPDQLDSDDDDGVGDACE